MLNKNNRKILHTANQIDEPQRWSGMQYCFVISCCHLLLFYLLAPSPANGGSPDMEYIAGKLASLDLNDVAEGAKPNQVLNPSYVNNEDGYKPMQQMPAELAGQIVDLSGIVAYIAALKASKELRDTIRLPLRSEIELLKREFSRKSAWMLMHTHIEDLMRIEQESGKLDEFTELISSIFELLDLDSDIMTACLAPFVSNKRLGNLWRGYAAAGDSKALRRIVWLAAEMGSVDTMDAIVAKAEETQRELDLAAENNCLLRKAVEKGNVEVVNYLLDRKERNPKLYGRISPAVQENYALAKAAENKDVTMIKCLLDRKIKHPSLYQDLNPAANGNAVIKQAIEDGLLEVVQCLLKYKEEYHGLFGTIDPAALENYAFAHAAQNGHLAMLQYLVKKKEENPGLYGEIDPAGLFNYGIRGAAKNGHLHVLEYLLGLKEANPTAYGTLDPSAVGNGAIKWAALDGRLEVIKFLLRKKEEKSGLYRAIDPTVNDNEAIRAAFRRGHRSVVDYLLMKKKQMPDLYGGIQLNGTH